MTASCRPWRGRESAGAGAQGDLKLHRATYEPLSLPFPRSDGGSVGDHLGQGSWWHISPRFPIMSFKKASPSQDVQPHLFPSLSPTISKDISAALHWAFTALRCSGPCAPRSLGRNSRPAPLCVCRQKASTEPGGCTMRHSTICTSLPALGSTQLLFLPVYHITVCLCCCNWHFFDY